MGRPGTGRLGDLIGYLKDKASLTKAGLLSKSDSPSPHSAILRATTHDPYSPPSENHLHNLLSYGNSSRLPAAACIKALMDRLHTTRSSSVAFKCLISIHHIILRGSFILQDQLSIYPSAGGRNYLNLSNFRDDSNPILWYLSSWVRWYARVLEQILYMSRVVGGFLSATSCTTEEKVTSLTNGDLLKEMDALVGVVEEIGKLPDYAIFHENRLVGEVARLVGEESVVIQKEILVRVKEVRERLSCLSFSDSVELVCTLKRLEICKEQVLFLSSDGEKSKAGNGDLLLGLIREMNERIGMAEENGSGRKLKDGARLTESARFSTHSTSLPDSVRFSSARFGVIF